MSAMSTAHAEIEALRPLMQPLEPHVGTALAEVNDRLATALAGLDRLRETPLYDAISHIRDIARLVDDAKGLVALMAAGELQA